MSLKDAIANAADLGSEDVEVPEWNVTVRVSSVSLAKRDELIKAWRDRADDALVTDASAEILTATLRDPATNEPIFASVEEARGVLAARDSKVVDRIVGVANRVCGFDSPAAEQVEEAKKSV